MKYFDKTSETLLLKLKNESDPVSWQRFVQIYTPFIKSIITRMRVKPQDLEDLSQDIILKSWKSFSTFSYRTQSSSFRSWLKVLTKNTVLNYFAKKSNQELSYGDNVEPCSTNSLIDESEVYHIMDSEWKSYISNLAWNNVKDSFGSVAQQIFLMDAKGTSIPVIVETLAITKSNVYKTRERVREKLSREIRRLAKELE
jgi:RNA polymerase sigma factor (sigma-70 family)